MRAILLSLVAALALPASGSTSVIVPWVSVAGSWATYGMSDVNREIASINAAFSDSGLAIRMDEVHNGLGFEVAAGLDLPGGFAVGLGYQRLSASTNVSDGSSALAYELPANAFSLRGSYRFPTPGAGGFSLGLGVGWISEAGSVRLSAMGYPAFAFDLEGSGLLLEPFATGDWSVTPRVAVTGSAGYRRARVPEIQIFNQTVYNIDGSKYSVDYSGVLMRFGLRLALTR